MHHKNRNSLDNTPSNLLKEDRGSHSRLHDTFGYLTIDQRIENGKLAAKLQEERLKNDPEFRKMKSGVGHTNMTNNWNNTDFRNSLFYEHSKEKSRKAGDSRSFYEIRGKHVGAGIY